MTIADDPLITVTVSGTSPDQSFSWGDGQEFLLPLSVVTSLGLEVMGGTAELREARGGRGLADINLLRLRAAYTPNPPASTRFPINYQRLPGFVRRGVARAIGLSKRRSANSWARFPRWPVDLSADFLADLSGMPPSPFANGPAPVILSHDIDTPQGLGNLLRLFLPAEEAVGARSSNYVVPCAWPLDHGALGEVVARGHELGIHGYNHGNRTPFSSAGIRRQRLEATRPLVERYGVQGYRAPSLLRTEVFLAELGRIFRYDSSIPTTGGLFPIPNTGCASARPFQVAGIWEIPISMPRDASMRFLMYSPERILSLWTEVADRIARSGGVIMLLTHCEDEYSGHPRMQEIYQKFLDHIAASRQFVWSTPAEVLTHMEAVER